MQYGQELALVGLSFVGDTIQSTALIIQFLSWFILCYAIVFFVFFLH